ncbi:MAG: hypothetical protein HFH68_13395 [Lachnospiraceae bacterium]|nr:hypothetical protein [Lachnospiraceae bacterium]
MEDRNQIWAPYLSLIQKDANPGKLHYKVKNNRVSPYLEMQADSLYGNRHENDFQNIDVNPYVRFFSIFGPLLTPDDLGYEEFNQALSDIILHYLADIDLKAGMCKQDFYTGFIVQDMESGVFGGAGSMAVFTMAEKWEAARILLCLYKTGDSVWCLSLAIKRLLPVCDVLIREGEEFVFHMKEPWDEADSKKLLFLIRLFLPLSFPYTIHWGITYGITGYDETMKLGGFVLA